MERGDLVILNDNEAFIKSEFSKSFFAWDDKMKFMLGKSYTILEIFDSKTVALPSPDGSQNGLWYFPKTVVMKLDKGVVDSFLKIFYSAPLFRNKRFALNLMP